MGEPTRIYLILIFISESNFSVYSAYWCIDVYKEVYEEMKVKIP